MQRTRHLMPSGPDLRLFAALFAPIALAGATLVAMRESR
jgi:hypothetical protein